MTVLKARAGCQFPWLCCVLHTVHLGWPRAPLAYCTWQLGAQEVRFEALNVTDTVAEALQPTSAARQSSPALLPTTSQAPPVRLGGCWLGRAGAGAVVRL